MGLEEDFQGLVDLVQLKAYHFHGSSGSVPKACCLLGCVLVCIIFIMYPLMQLCLLFFAYCSENIVAGEIPADMEALVADKRRELIETVSEVDDKLADAFLSDEPISPGDLEVC